MNFAVTAKIDPDSERKLRAALDQFPIAVQDAIVRKAMRPFLSKELKSIRAINGNKLPAKDAKAKVKIMPGGVVWGAVAYKTGSGRKPPDKGGRGLRAVYDSWGTGWRSHFTELGTHAWSSALAVPPSAGRYGKGWKRKLYHRGRGTFIRGTHASEVTARMFQSQFRPMVISAVNSAIESRRAPGSRLRTVDEFS